MPTVTALRTRRPTGRPSWPLVLLAGEAKTGKTYQAAEFTGDERVGRSFMLDLGEGSADEYGAVPGADYEIIDHDGTWVDIITQVEAVRELAREELAAGRQPVCLIIDSMTTEWAMLSTWTDTRARRSNKNKTLLAKDPDAEIDISANYWNDANSRHNRLMNILKTFPGIVIMTTLETEKTQFGADGRPVANAPKVARPDGQKRITADSTVWVRLSHEAPPTIVGIRSLRNNIVPGKDRPQPWEGFTIAKLVFEFMGLGPVSAEVRDVPRLDADQVAPGEEPDDAPRTVAPPHVTAANTVTRLLDCDDHEVAQRVAKWTNETAAVGSVDISGLLSDVDRERLDTGPKSRPVSLRLFADLVASYIERTGRSVRADEPVDVPAAVA